MKPILVSAEDAASLYRTTVRYVYKLASLNNWRRAKNGREVRYYLEDVDASLGRDTAAT